MTARQKAGVWGANGCSRVGLGGLVVAALLAGSSVGAGAQELSEKSMHTFMDYAWALTPQKFTKPNGESVIIDKKKRDAVMVPMDVVREVIRVGRLSAHAQVCQLADEQVENYRSLMRREELKKKWTPQQLIFINQLHLTTVMLLTGNLKLVEKDGNKEVVVQENKAKTQTCSDEQKAKVRQVINDYIKTGPSVRSEAPPATAAAPAPTAEAKASPPTSKK
jgi:hypothetical protein